MKIVFGLVGEPASGKGTVAKYLDENYHAKTLAFSTPMKECVQRLHLPLVRENLAKFSELTRQAFGEDLYSHVVAEDAKKLSDPIVVVDGIRRPADYVNLKELPEFHMIYVTAPIEVRWQRARLRGEKDNEADMTLEQFKKEALLSTELEIKSIGEKAEFTIDNSGTVEDLHAAVESIIKKIQAA